MRPQRKRLPKRRTKTFSVERTRLAYTTTLEAVIALLAKQPKVGAELETLRQALSRDSRGRASGVLGAALDLIARSS